MYALLIGINRYQRSTSTSTSTSTLKSCVEDVTRVRQYLLRRGYPEANIICLTDEAATSANILTAMTSFLSIKDATERWFHYSGHGTHLIDRSGDEKDFYDEAIVPVDYAVSGLITDDKLHLLLQAGLPLTGKLIFVFDCCHSGTMLDLKYIYTVNQGSINREIDQGPSPLNADITMISGCRDLEGSGETATSGRLTGALITILESPTRPTTKPELLLALYRCMREQGVSQIPMICSSCLDLGIVV